MLTASSSTTGRSFRSLSCTPPWLLAAFLHLAQLGTFAASAAGISLPQAVDAAELVWSADADWTVTTNVTHDGVAAIRSSQSRGAASVSVELLGPGKLTFWWRAISDSGFGWIYTEFYLDGSQKSSLPVSDTPWRSYSIDIPSGFHRASWRAFKPFTSAVNADYSLVDSVRFEPSTPPKSPVLTVLPPESGTGDFRFQVERPLGRICTVDSSADLKTWTPLVVLSDRSALAVFTDKDTATSKARFYRAHSP